MRPDSGRLLIRIEHRAVVHAIRSVNPDLIVSVNSVGTMIESLPPGRVGVVTDVLDLSSKAITFHSSDAVHADRTNSFSGAAHVAARECRHRRASNTG